MLKRRCAVLLKLRNSFYLNKFSSEGTQEKEENLETVKQNEESERLRNVSRLPEKLRNRMLHILKPSELEVRPDLTTQMNRKPQYKNLIYACYGKKSGFHPGFLWPSQQQLEDQLEFEAEYEPTLKQKMETLRLKQEERSREIKEKENKIEEQMSKMPQYIKEYQMKLKKASDQELEAQRKKKILLDEARDFFGYSISPNDPRFEQMKIAKEEEEKKLAKKMKKEAKIAKKSEKMKS